MYNSENNNKKFKKRLNGYGYDLTIIENQR